MSHDTPLVIAHRTTMGHAPENTLLGIHKALEMGCDGVEIDVQLSADGVPVLLHDDLLDRTTNGSGRVLETAFADLRSLDAGQGERIPTLREALELIDGRMLFVIELKVSPGDDAPALCDAVLEEVERADALPWVWFWSFDSDTVIQVGRTRATRPADRAQLPHTDARHLADRRRTSDRRHLDPRHGAERRDRRRLPSPRHGRIRLDRQRTRRHPTLRRAGRNRNCGRLPGAHPVGTLSASEPAS